ncbi:MAG: hemin uptake protein HemP [Methylococcaceae bacterium]
MTIYDNNDKFSKKKCPTQNAHRMIIKSHQLFNNQNEVIIEHDGSEYRLRITSSGKLILTK